MCANLRKCCANPANFAQIRQILFLSVFFGPTPPFITNKFGKFRANPANFAQIRQILFLSAFVGLTLPFITSPFDRFQVFLGAFSASAAQTVRRLAETRASA